MTYTPAKIKVKGHAVQTLERKLTDGHDRLYFFLANVVGNDWTECIECVTRDKRWE